MEGDPLGPERPPVTSGHCPGLGKAAHHATNLSEKSSSAAPRFPWQQLLLSVGPLVHRFFLVRPLSLWRLLPLAPLPGPGWR